MNKIDYNKKMIGKEVILSNHTPNLKAEVVDVVDDESFLVKLLEGEILTVSIYDVRSLDNVSKKEKAE